MVIVALGASAGGLEPLENYFQNLKPTPKAAFVVVQHLAPNYKSLMDQLLSRHTSLPIEIIEEGTQIEEGKIYLNPPKKVVKISKEDKLKFSLETKNVKGLSFPISNFLQSLSSEHATNVIGIIFSGTGSDGSEGLKKIKEDGGITLVQDPGEAKFDGMPKNAIYTGAVDFILPVEELSVKTLHLVDDLVHNRTSRRFQKTQFLNKIVTLVKKHTGMDFKAYKESTIHRRIDRRIAILGCKSNEAYLKTITASEEEARALCEDLFIGVTSFFRDDGAFGRLEEDVIPKICHKEGANERIRVWIPACSTGEEAYSVAILIKEQLKAMERDIPVTIFATDINREAIKRAGLGVFNASLLKNIDHKNLNKYFISSSQGQFRIKKEIRDMIVFSVHNILRDPPFSKIDLISCRNFLIYLKPEVQQKIYSYFRYSLHDEGYLFLGSSESLGDMQEYFEEVDRKFKIYKNVKSASLPDVDLLKNDLGARTFATKNTMENKKIINRSESRFSPEKLNKVLIQKYVPQSIIVDRELNIVHTVGNVFEFLHFPPGEFSNNIIELVPEELKITLEILLKKVEREENPMQLKDISLIESDKSRRFDLIIKSLKDRDMGDGFRMMEIHEKVSEGVDQEDEQTTLHIKKFDLDLDSKAKIKELEDEIKYTKENLQTTIEELETSNEELQSTNEELQSSNEELESVNEELYTVNAEYQEKVEELSVLNDDLNNLLNSSDISILFLDENLYIRRITKSIKRLLNIDERDLGRSITDFTSKIDFEKIINEIKKVHESLNSKELAVNDADGNVYVLKISPFRTFKNEIKGVVLSFLDITQLESNEKELSELQNSLIEAKNKISEQEDIFRLIALHSSDMISIHGLDYKFQYASPSCKELTGKIEQELKDSELIDLVDERDRGTLLKGLKTSQQGKNAGPVTFRYKNSNGELKWLESHVKCITDNSGEPSKILLTTRDITEKVKYQDELSLLSNIVKETNNAVLVTDSHEKILWVNEAFVERTGYAWEECKGKSPGELLQGEETDPKIIHRMKEGVLSEKGFDVEVINYTKSKDKFWVRIQCQPVYDSDNNLKGFFAIQSDISLQKSVDEKFRRFNKELEKKNFQLELINNELRQFAHMASHDLKEPVRGITGILDIIKEDYGVKLGEEGMEVLDMGINSGSRMIELINGLLEFSQTGKLSEKEEWVDLKKVIGMASENLAMLMEKNEATVEVGHLPKIKGFEQLLVRLFQNLISNAVKYKGSESPIITISYEKEDNYHKIFVKDNGSGIREQDIPKLFKVFSRLKIKSKVEGSGLGLYICKQIMEQHGGTISASSTYGSHTIFILRFPKTK
ncbi:CheR family methyltransferase [Pleomorphovibrio marinus]|uniref:CheR family methyltransferase n=1 Tax=Pleomorphovibrio marinus TaxID=2164132 RepID=UPI000E0BB382|nr:CheR family methyltransferase [Pleomorphovibrio marinus]